MRLAYLISAHTQPDLLVRLVHKLQSPNAIFLIHVDKKSNPNIFNQMQEGLKNFSNVRFLERNEVYWANFGIVQATLKGIRELVTKNISFDYAIYLTGSDYPIKTNGAIEDFFSQNRENSFISWKSLPDHEWKAIAWVEHWHYRIGNRWFIFPLYERKRFNGLVKAINHLFPTKRPFLPNMKQYGGSSYWNLTREAVYYIYDYISCHPDFVRFFKSTWIPDELFFQTLLLNSPLKDKIINDDLRYLDWSNHGSHPAILRQNDFGNLSTSPKLFARKFDMNVECDILDMIDKNLLQE
jgi:Core-2/I-Branching enzyme